MAQDEKKLDKCDEIALEWLRRQDVSGKSPREFAEMFKTARQEIQDALRSEFSRNYAENLR